MRVVRNGDPIVARVDDGQVMVKIYRESGDDMVVLVSVNPVHPPVVVHKEDLIFVHRVVWKKEKG